jgi:paraquat-inducible protein B
VSRSASPAAVGAFVLGAIALAIGGVIFFGGGHWLADVERYVIYFEGSVNGLQVGSPVKMEGVPIGEVCEIRLIADVTEGLEAYSQTVIEIDSNRFERRGMLTASVSDRLKRLIDAGLRARLELQSLITGQLYVSLELLPDSEVRLVGLPGTPHPEIPAVPTVAEEILATVRAALQRLQELPFEEVVEKLNSVITGIDRFVNDPELSGAVANLNATLGEARGAVADARVLIRDFDRKVDPIADSAVAALDQAQQTLASAERSVAPDSALAYQLAQALRELTDAARAMRELAVYLERNPNSVVFGRPSEP